VIRPLGVTFKNGQYRCRPVSNPETGAYVSLEIIEGFSGILKYSER
jgi:hypothetical protein